MLPLHSKSFNKKAPRFCVELFFTHLELSLCKGGLIWVYHSSFIFRSFFVKLSNVERRLIEFTTKADRVHNVG